MAQAVVFPRNLVANGPVLIKAGIGVFATVTINRVGTGGNTLTCYDGTDATGLVLATIDTTSALGTFIYDAVVRDGIFVVMAGGAAADVTIGWS